MGTSLVLDSVFPSTSLFFVIPFLNFLLQHPEFRGDRPIHFLDFCQPSSSYLGVQVRCRLVRCRTTCRRLLISISHLTYPRGVRAPGKQRCIMLYYSRSLRAIFRTLSLHVCLFSCTASTIFFLNKKT